MKSAGSSVEVAFMTHCGPKDLTTGTGYIEEIESTEYDYFEQNNKRVVKVLDGQEAIDYLKKRGMQHKKRQNIEIALTVPTYAPHMSPRMIQNDAKEHFTTIKDYYKVTILRDPWAALVSYFWWAFYEPKILGDTRREDEKYSPKTMPHMAPIASDPPHVLQQKFQLFLENPATFKTPYRECKEHTILAWFSEWQNEFYMGVDHIMQYENLQNEYDDLCHKLGVSSQKLPLLKSTQKKSSLSHKLYYNDTTHSRVSEAFSDILKKFNFSI